MVADVEPVLAGITVHAIGFGAESSLNGALLTALASAHGGLYMRAGGGLALTAGPSIAIFLGPDPCQAQGLSQASPLS